MFELYDSENTSSESTNHPVVAPLLRTIKESLFVISADPNRGKKFNDLNDLKRSPALLDSLSKLEGSEQTSKASRQIDSAATELNNLPVDSDSLKAINSIITEVLSNKSDAELQKKALLLEVESCKAKLEENKSDHVSALSGGNFEAMTAIDESSKEIGVNIAKLQKKIIFIEENSKFAFDNLLQIFSAAKNNMLTRHKEKCVIDLKPEFQDAKAEFLKTCQKIAAYDPSQFLCNQKSYGLSGFEEKVIYGELWTELATDVRALYANKADVEQEILTAG